MDGTGQVVSDVQPPFVLSMIICDAVHIDPGTGKAFILGCFSSIGATSFPATHHKITVFAEVTDCQGRTPFRIRVVDVDEQHEPVVEAETESDIPDPLAITVLVLNLNGIVFPSQGEYRVQLFSRDVPIMERRLSLVPHSEEQLA